MIARTMLGAQLLACAEECGSVAALAREIGVCPGSLSDLIEGGEPSMRTFRAVVAYLAVGADAVLEAMDSADDGRQWTPPHALGGIERRAAKCEDCGREYNKAALKLRWAEGREERERKRAEAAARKAEAEAWERMQLTIMEASA